LRASSNDVVEQEKRLVLDVVGAALSRMRADATIAKAFAKTEPSGEAIEPPNPSKKWVAG
jgi:hypothetical protein